MQATVMFIRYCDTDIFKKKLFFEEISSNYSYFDSETWSEKCVRRSYKATAACLV